MCTSVVTEIVRINRINPDCIESYLNHKYNSVIRWAVAKVFDDILEISVTYEKTSA